MASSAAAAIIVGGDVRKQWGGMDSDYWIMDCSAATENILLAAESMGLGAVWTAVYPEDEPHPGRPADPGHAFPHRAAEPDSPGSSRRQGKAERQVQPETDPLEQVVGAGDAGLRIDISGPVPIRYFKRIRRKHMLTLSPEARALCTRKWRNDVPGIYCRRGLLHPLSARAFRQDGQSLTTRTNTARRKSTA